MFCLHLGQFKKLGAVKTQTKYVSEMTKHKY